MENRFKKYLGLIIAVAATVAVLCMVTTDMFWGLLIGVAVVPIACLFACGAIAIFEVCKQRQPKQILQEFEEPSEAYGFVEELDKR